MSKHNCQKNLGGKNYYCSKNLDGKNHYHPRILTNHKKVGSSRVSFSLFLLIRFWILVRNACYFPQLTYQFISAKQVTVAKSLLSWCIYCVCMYLVWYWRMNGKINSTVVFLLILIWTENLHVLHIHQRPCSPYYLNA